MAFNPYKAKHKNAKIFENHLKTCHVGFTRIALVKYPQMRNHESGFQ